MSKQQNAVCRNCLRPTSQSVKGVPYCSKSCIDERWDKWTRVAKQTTAYWKKRAQDSPQHEWCDSCEKSHWKHFDSCPYCGGQGKQVATDGGTEIGVECNVDGCETHVVGLDDGWEMDRGTVCQDCIDYRDRHGHWPDEDVEICAECRIDDGMINHDCDETGADRVLLEPGSECNYCGYEAPVTDGGENIDRFHELPTPDRFFMQIEPAEIEMQPMAHDDVEFKMQFIPGGKFGVELSAHYSYAGRDCIQNLSLDREGAEALHEALGKALEDPRR